MYEYDVLGNLKRHDYTEPYKLSLPEGKSLIEALGAFIVTYGDFVEDITTYDSWDIKGFPLTKEKAAGIIKILEWYRDIKKEGSNGMDQN